MEENNNMSHKAAAVGATPATLKVEVVNSSSNPLPSYSTPLSAGMDIRAAVESAVELPPLGRTLVPTGLRVAIPEGYELQLRPRSGLAIRDGITLLNSPGTIDADFRGEIKVIVINLSDKPFTINRGDRICQAVLAPYVRVEWSTADRLEATDRGEGGFGHTGVK